MSLHNRFPLDPRTVRLCQIVGASIFIAAFFLPACKFIGGRSELINLGTYSGWQCAWFSLVLVTLPETYQSPFLLAVFGGLINPMIVAYVACYKPRFAPHPPNPELGHLRLHDLHVGIFCDQSIPSPYRPNLVGRRNRTHSCRRIFGAAFRDFARISRLTAVCATGSAILHPSSHSVVHTSRTLGVRYSGPTGSETDSATMRSISAIAPASRFQPTTPATASS
jgi:hypothetical protein